MLRPLSALAVALALTLAFPAAAATHHKKRHVTRHWHGYGFLPGYRPPEQIQREYEERMRRRGPAYIYAYPGFYRGRWNGGGFGYCYERTPIGPMWTCGR